MLLTAIGVCLIVGGLGSMYLEGRQKSIAAAGPQTSAQRDCATSAFTDYNAALTTLLLAQPTIPAPGELALARRRLQEKFCARFARCLVPTQEPGAATAYSLAFAQCLRDEEREADSP